MENFVKLEYAVIYSEFVEGVMGCCVVGFYPTFDEAKEAMATEYKGQLENINPNQIINEYKDSTEIQLDLDGETHYHYEVLKLMNGVAPKCKEIFGK